MKKIIKLQLSNKTLGIILYTLALLTTVLLVSVFKRILLTYNLPIEQAIFMRQCIIVLFLIPIINKSKFNFFTPKKLIPNIERNTIFFISTLFLYKALRLIPLNDATAIQFLTPILASIMSVFLLKEKISNKTWIGLILAFSGVLWIKKPSLQMFNANSSSIGYLFIFLCAIIRGYIVILSKKLTTICKPIEMSIYTNIIMLILSATYFRYFVMFDVAMIPLLIISAVGFFTEYYLTYEAYKRCEASVLQPLDFLKLIFSVIISYVILAEKITFNQICGSGIILVSYMYTINWKKIFNNNKVIK